MSSVWEDCLFTIIAVFLRVGSGKHLLNKWTNEPMNWPKQNNNLLSLQGNRVKCWIQAWDLNCNEISRLNNFFGSRNYKQRLWREQRPVGQIAGHNLGDLQAWVASWKTALLPSKPILIDHAGSHSNSTSRFTVGICGIHPFTWFFLNMAMLSLQFKYSCYISF